MSTKMFVKIFKMFLSVGGVSLHFLSFISFSV